MYNTNTKTIYSKPSDLYIIHWNCFALTLKRRLDLISFLVEHNPDVMCLNELKLNEAESNVDLQFTGYSSYFRCRDPLKSFGGGVCILVKSTLSHVQEDVGSGDLELLAVTIETSSAPVTVVSYYNPPSSSLSTDILRLLADRNSHLIIVGDLNSKTTSVGCKETNRNGRLLEEAIGDSNLVVLNDRTPTYHSHIYDDYSELLDLAICSPSTAQHFRSFEVLLGQEMGSDHSPIAIRLSLIASRQLRPQVDTHPRFNYDKADWNEFRARLNCNPPTSALLDANELALFVTQAIMDAAKGSIPQVSANAHKGSKLPPHIIALIKHRKEIRKRCKRDPGSKPYLNQLTTRISQAIAEEKDQQWQQFLDRVGPNQTSSRPFWKRINETRQNNTTNNSIPNLAHAGLIIKQDAEKAAVFSSILETTFNGTTRPCNEQHRARVDSEVDDFRARQWQLTSSVELFEVKAAIKKLRNTSAPGPTGIHNRMLRQLSDDFLLLLVQLLNLTLEQHTFPSLWKHARVSMLFKGKGRRDDPSNYRPISVTCCLGKLAERVIHHRIYTALEGRGFFVDSQSGFRARRRTTDNLFYLSQKVKENMCRGKRVCCLLFDIQKAFDNVWHNGLINKMLSAQLPPYIVAWVADFLDQRSFQVAVGGAMSDRCRIRAGVPQGAVLSPLLFNIFINDIPLMNMKNQCHSMLFADDLATFFIYRKSGHLVARVKQYLTRLERWLTTNRLEMNAKKCTYTIFSRGNTDTDFCFPFNGSKISEDKEPKLLGVVLDQRLTFGKHVDYIRDRCASRLNILRIIAHKSWRLSTRTLLVTYQCLIGSIIDYSAFSHSCISQTNMHKLQTIQNKSIRIILHLPYDTNTLTYNFTHGISTIKSRLLYLTNKYLCYALQKNTPLIANLFAEFIDSYNSIICDNNCTTPICSFLHSFSSIR